MATKRKKAAGLKRLRLRMKRRGQSYWRRVDQILRKSGPLSDKILKIQTLEKVYFGKLT